MGDIMVDFREGLNDFQKVNVHVLTSNRHCMNN